MRRIVLSTAFSCLAVTILTGCVGDDTAVAVPDAGGALEAGPDATTGDAGPADGTVNASESGTVEDASHDASDGSAGPGYLLFSYAFDEFQNSELDAVDLATGQTSGRLSYTQGGTNVATSASPWVLEQFDDIVAKMDPARPWIPTSTWSVASPPPDAGGYSYADAISVAETAGKAYVALYNRDSVPVLDTSATVDAGAPATRIDLSSLLQPADPDGSVEDTAAIYDESTQRVWLVLGNIDEYTVAPPTYDLLCVSGLRSTVVAIDATNDQLVSGLTFTLSGINPGSVVFDAPNERLIVLSAGCNEPPEAGSDAGPGALVGRLIEQVDLKTGVSTVLYDATSQGFPGQLVYVNANQAFVSFGYGAPTTYGWDPTSTSLGATIVGAPDAFAWDGHGLIGPKTTYLEDGGVSIAVVEVVPLTGETTTIDPNPVSVDDPTGGVEGVGLWTP